MNQTIWKLCAAMLLSQLLVLVVQHRHLSLIEQDDEDRSTPRRPNKRIHNSHNRLSHQLDSSLNNHGTLANIRTMTRLKQEEALLDAAKHDEDSLQKQQQRLLVHLHIGKTGGSSLDKIGPLLAHDSNRTYFPHVHMHFDWSFIQELPNQELVDVVTILRHPVDRAVSQFHYAKTLKWTRNKPIGSMTLDEYLSNKTEMLHTRTVWADGQAATWWLTGTHVERWVNVPPTQVNEREVQYATNATHWCHLAADRLEQTLWFGLIEDVPRSMELLQHALQLPERPILPRANGNSHPKPTKQQKEALASLMPRDLWVYKYGKRLFEARYHAMKMGEDIVLPARPPIPETWTCNSTRTRLDCSQGPFQGTFQLPPKKERVQVKQK